MVPIQVPQLFFLIITIEKIYQFAVYIFRKISLTLRCEVLFDISHFFINNNKKKERNKNGNHYNSQR